MLLALLEYNTNLKLSIFHQTQLLSLVNIDSEVTTVWHYINLIIIIFITAKARFVKWNLPFPTSKQWRQNTTATFSLLEIFIRRKMQQTIQNERKK